jgi:hypothetical protein
MGYDNLFAILVGSRLDGKYIVEVTAIAKSANLLLQSITWSFCIIYMLATKVPDPFLGPKGVRLLLLFRGSSGLVVSKSSPFKADIG